MERNGGTNMYPNWILQRAYLTPSRIALTFEGQQWTFEDIKNISIERAEQLTALGIVPRSRVAILGPNTPQLLFMIYGCMQLQCEMVMLNRRLSTHELIYQIEDSEVSTIIVDDEYAQKLDAYTHKIRFTDVENSKKSFVPISHEWVLDDTLSIMYTSGTTGFPKGVRQTVGNHHASATASALNIGLSESDIWLCFVPIFHISGFSILIRSLLYGNEVNLYRQFDADAAVKDIVAGRVTHMSIVAVALERVISSLEKQNLMASPKFKIILAGGGPVPENYIVRAQKRGMKVAQTYGMTETASQSVTLSNEDALRKIGSAGKPLFFNQIRIDGVTSEKQEGEICIRGPHVTPGYIGRFINKPTTIDGWLYTGDIGYLDQDGYLYVVDRRSDLIISGGENIYPAEIENVLLSHPAIQEAGVCGIDDETWGQVPIAFVVLKNNCTMDEIIYFCKERLASYKVPKKIIFVDALPRNGSNKLMRRNLKELL